jgi:multidrug efflux system outer membrane protein
MKRIVTLGFAALVGGCSLAPPLETPTVDTPAAWKEPLAADERGTWKVAEPSEALPRGEWWKVFRDPVLDGLVDQANAANQTVAVAAARVRQSRAIVGIAQAERIPQVSGGIGPYRYKPSGANRGLPDGTDVAPYTVWRGILSLSYEVDLFGRVANNIAATRADAESAEASFRSVQLAMQADVAQTYFALRQADAELSVLRATIALRAETTRLLQRRYDLGDIGEFDLARSRADLGLAQAEAAAVERRRAQLEHALALLGGRAPASFSLAPAPQPVAVPGVPAGLPSALLERRPDIAAAQRTLAASNARIGIAKAAFFPSLTLTGFGGYESSDLGNLFQWSSRTWLLGPLFGTLLTMPIIDGGRNQSNLDRTYAVLEENVASYRQTVLVAFTEVEDQLASLRTLATQADALRDAVGAAQRSFAISNTRFDNGASSFLDVIEAQRTLLAVQLLDAQTQGARAISTVALIRALGGGWDAPPGTAAAK